DPVLPGVDVEHMDPAAPAGGEGAGHGDVLVTRGRGASRPFWPLTARAHSAVVSPPARDEAASRAAVRRSRRRSYAAPPSSRSPRGARRPLAAAPGSPPRAGPPGAGR